MVRRRRAPSGGAGRSSATSGNAVAVLSLSLNTREAVARAREFANVLKTIGDRQRVNNGIGTVFTNIGSKISATYRRLSKDLAVFGLAVRGIREAGDILRGLFDFSGLGPVLRTSSFFEDANIQLSVLLGSTQRGGEAFRGLIEYAKQVPATFQDLVRSAVPLGSVSNSVEDLLRLTSFATDISFATGIAVPVAASQLQRIYSSGPAAADTFRERGVLQLLGFRQGVRYSAGEARRIIEEGFESGAIVFAGAAERALKTFRGINSQFVDHFNLFLLDIGNAGIFARYKGIAQGVLDIFRENEELAKSIALEISNGMVTALNIALLLVRVVVYLFREWGFILQTVIYYYLLRITILLAGGLIGSIAGGVARLVAFGISVVTLNKNVNSVSRTSRLLRLALLSIVGGKIITGIGLLINTFAKLLISVRRVGIATILLNVSTTVFTLITSRIGIATAALGAFAILIENTQKTIGGKSFIGPLISSITEPIGSALGDTFRELTEALDEGIQFVLPDNTSRINDLTAAYQSLTAARNTAFISLDSYSTTPTVEEAIQNARADLLRRTPNGVFGPEQETVVRINFRADEITAATDAVKEYVAAERGRRISLSRITELQNHLIVLNREGLGSTDKYAESVRLITEDVDRYNEEILSNTETLTMWQQIGLGAVETLADSFTGTLASAIADGTLSIDSFADYFNEVLARIIKSILDAAIGESIVESIIKPFNRDNGLGLGAFFIPGGLSGFGEGIVDESLLPGGSNSGFNQYGGPSTGSGGGFSAFSTSNDQYFNINVQSVNDERVGQTVRTSIAEATPSIISASESKRSNDRRNGLLVEQ